MRHERSGATPPEEARTEIEVERERAWVEPGASLLPADPPLPPDGAPEQLTPRFVHEEERVEVGEDGRLRRVVDRVEQPPRRRTVPSMAPALLVLLGLVLGGLAAAWYLTREETRAVPSVTGDALEQAVTELQAEGFVTDIVRRASDAPEGTVFEQNPAAGTEADDGSQVRILVSEGPATKPVPNAVGVDEALARDRLAAAGLEVQVVEVFSEEQEGTVVAQNPPAGRRVGEGETVRLNVSKGTGLVDVPALVGRSADSAEAELEQLGLGANVVEVPSREPAGTVVAQHPSAGQARVGSSVRLNVSAGS